ncbi:hypothetical protein [Haloferula sargassicola]
MSTRVALAFGVLLSGAFGLAAAVYIKPAAPTLRTVAVPAAGSRAPQEFEKNRPTLVSTRADEVARQVAPADGLIRFCSSHVTETRSFVIFRHGTCVVLQEPVTDPIAEAERILRANNDPEARFLPELTSEGNLIVGFKEPLFHTFTAAEREAMLDELTKITPALLTPSERVSAADDWVPPTHARFGLLARRRMLEDAAKPIPVKVIRASRAVAAND